MQPLDKPRWLYSPLFVPVALLGLTMAMFADVLFIHGDRVLSGEGEDTYTYFLYQRQFGFEQLRAGHFPLWNPHIYSGAPFFGAFQSAMLYPPNWILYLTLPLVKAINYEFVLHTDKGVAPGGGALYVFSDASYRPKGEDASAAFRMGAGGPLETLVRH